MTQEEKAKRYDEALEKAKVYHNDYTKDIMEDVFPELAESEDEKIRKTLIQLFQSDNEESFGEFTNKQFVSWLEKQGGEKDSLSIDFVLGYLGIKPAYKDGNAWCILLGDNIQEGICGFGDTKEEALIAFMKELIEKQGEHANFLSKIQVGDKVTRNEAGVLVNLSQLNRVAKPEENKGNIGGISPNWSEKDEAVLDALIRRLEGEDIYVSPHLAVECLKSIKGRVGCEANCTTIKEWSKEDKKKIDRIYLLISEAADEHAFGTTCRLIGDKECVELQEWLKSLRPQKRWKPSDEQMGCLSDAIEHYNSLGYPAPKLKELLDDLKKLKEGNV